MANLAENTAKLIFEHADREAKHFNRYNKDDQGLEFAYKEGYYQKRIQELLALQPKESLAKLHTIISNRFNSERP